MLGVFGIAPTNLPNSVILALWVICPMIGGIGSFALFRSYSDADIAPSYKNRIITRAWLFIIAALVLTVCIEIFKGFGDPRFILITAAFLFSIALAITSSMNDVPYALYSAIGWLAIGVISYLSGNIQTSLLAMSAGSVLFLVLPGIVMRRTNQKTG